MVRRKQRFQELTEFCSAHGHLPSRGSKDAAEAKLAVWVERQQGAAFPVVGLAKVLEQYPTALEHRALLEGGGVSLRQRRKTRSRGLVTIFRTRELEEFLRVQGRRPSRRAEDRIERRLAEWMYANQRRGTLTAKSEQLLEQYPAPARGRRKSRQRRSAA